MNSSKAESIAITAVENEVNKFDNLQPNFNKRDKNPVWDGSIELYKCDSDKTADIVGVIPVQIKGRSDAENDDEQAKAGKQSLKQETENEAYFSVKISDIENYRKSNVGAIYFLVKIDSNRNTKIYYKVFDLKTVEQILNEKNNQNTKRFKFELLKANELDSICINFIKNLSIYKSINILEKAEVYEKKAVCYNYNTKYELNEIRKSNKVFYETNAYKEARDKLRKQNIVILHGEPWVGKTTTARRLVQNYIEKGYMFVYGNVDDLSKIKEQVAIDEKIICLLDDFLGSNVQYLEKNVADSTLDKIVGIFKNSKNKKLIFTTRTYIYNNAKSLFYKFYKSTSLNDEYLIDVTNYSYEEKGNILYNHMKANNLLGTKAHQSIAENEFYVDIITNDNFNPGVIALICERLKDKNIEDVKGYILKALNTPDELWEEEYRKLTIYEKIILTIIVLFGIKVPEKYVKEQFYQIAKNENIGLLDSEVFAKSIKVLSESFVKITFDFKDEREFEVCKHSIADYIINKIKNKEIDVNRYINSAKFVELLRYIYIINNDEGIYEALAEKAEVEFNSLKDFYYKKDAVLFDIIKRSINAHRAKTLEKIIVDDFYRNEPRVVFNILEDETDVLYGFTVSAFEDEVIKNGNIDFAYNIRDIYECETFFKTCAVIFEYQKDTEFMLEYMSDFAEIVAYVISQEVESIINEQLTDSVAEDIMNGEKLEDIIRKWINSNFFDEIPSLKKLYSRKNLNIMLKDVYKLCDIQADEEAIDSAIENAKNNKELEETSKYYKYKAADSKQVRAIKEKFEEGIQLDKNKVPDYEYYGLLRSMKRGESWWEKSFFEDRDYNKLKLYKEFIDENIPMNESAIEFGENFLDYILHKKFNVSDKACEVLNNLAFDSFVIGKFYITDELMQKYSEQYPDEVKELFNTGIISIKDDKIRYINTFIHLYIAVKEMVNRKASLLQIILDWEDADPDEEDDVYIIEQLINIFYLYSELDRKEFNNIILGMLSCFVHSISNQYEKVGKMKVSKAILNSLETSIYFDVEFEYLGSINKLPFYIWFVEFVTGTNIVYDLFRFDYEIYQKVLYEKCFNEENGEYEIDFRKMLEDKELKVIGEKLKVWDFIYEVYLQCERTVDILRKDINTDVFNIGKKYIAKFFYNW